MDELTFQHELHQLKHRVAEMTACRQGRVSPRQPYSYTDDAFASQIEDIKVHLQALHMSLVSCPTRRSSFDPSYYERVSPSTDPVVQSTDTMLPAQSDASLTIDSGVWRLFSSMFDEMRAAKNRLAALESSMSELEDRVDTFDPNRFTPPVSVMSSDEHEMDAGVRSPLSLGALGTNTVSVARDATAACHSSRPAHDELKETLRHMTSALTMAPKILFDITRSPMLQTLPNDAYSSSSIGVELPANSAATFPRPQILEAHHGVDNVSDSFSSSIVSHGAVEDGRLYAHNEEQKSDQMQRRCLRFAQASSGLRDDISNDQAASVTNVHHPYGHILPTNPPGVAYRDQEIACLDELLRATTERLASSESLIANQDHRMRSLEQEHIELHETIHQQREKLSWADQISHDNLILLQGQQDREDQMQHATDRIAELQESFEYYRNTKEAEVGEIMASRQQREDQMQRATNRISELRESFEYYRNSKEAEIDQMMTSRDLEMKQAQEFCEQKDAVIIKQEQMIQRGAGLLVDKDTEIDGLERKVAALEEDERLTRLTRSQQAQLLRRNDDEVFVPRGQLQSRSAGQQVEADKQRYQEQLRRNGDSRHGKRRDRPHISMPFDSAADATHNRPAPEASLPWIPKPMNGYTKQLPHEEQRASAWQPEASRLPPKFGIPGPLSAHHGLALGHDGDKGKKVMFRRSTNGSVENVPFLPGQEPVMSQFVGPATKFTKESQSEAASSSRKMHSEGVPRGGHLPGRRTRPANGRPRLPLDASFCPPLPAPVTPPHKASSTADLRGARYQDSKAGPEGHHKLSKHHSLQELSRRKLQAYVETEAESGDERRVSSSLLD